MKGKYMYRKQDLQKPYYKTGEVAKMVDLHPRTIQGYCDSGRISFTRSSTNIRLIPQEAVVQFLTELGLFKDDKYSVGYVRLKHENERDVKVAELLMGVLKYNPVDMKILTEVNDDESQPRPQLDDLLDSIVAGNVEELFVLNRQSFGLVTYHIVQHMCDKHKVKLYILEELSDED